jgi:hypothetical protein
VNNQNRKLTRCVVSIADEDALERNDVSRPVRLTALHSIYSPLNICSQLPDHQKVIHLLRDYICRENLQEEIVSHTKIKVHRPDKASLPSDAHVFDETPLRVVQGNAALG